MTKSRGIRAYRRRRQWQIPELTYLWHFYPDVRAQVIADALDRSLRSVHLKAMQFGLGKSAAFRADPASGCNVKGHAAHGIATRFKKGQQPWNTGLRRPGWAPGRMSATQFKKGSKPQTWLPIGSERLSKDGIRQRKVFDTGYPPHDWKSVHSIMWEQANGPIPPKHIVVFKDGNRENIVLENLELLSRRQLLERNWHHNWPPELAKLVQLRGAVTRQINRREREEQDSGPT